MLATSPWDLAYVGRMDNEVFPLASMRDLRVPFGGMKQSGVGREGGEEALRFFTEPKNVCIAK